MRAIPDPFGDHEIGAAWARGVGVVTGQPVAVPRGGPLRDLAAVARAALVPRAPLHNLCAWIEADGEEFARARRGTSLNALKYVDWVASGRPPLPTRGPRRVQPEPATPSWETGPVETWAAPAEAQGAGS